MTPPTAAPPRCGTRPRLAVSCGFTRTPTRTSCPPGGSRAEDWLWLYGTDGAVGGNRCYLLNAAARELVPITQRMKNYTYNIPPSRLAQTADGRWLFWTESNDENVHVAYGLIAPTICRRQHRLYAGGDVGRVRRGSRPFPGKP